MIKGVLMKNREASRTVSQFAASACRVAAFGLVFLALGQVANAAVTPEIDAGSMSSGLALLTGGMLWLSGRRPRK